MYNQVGDTVVIPHAILDILTELSLLIAGL